MKYIEALEHYFKCSNSEVVDSLSTFITAIKSKDVVDWDLKARCRKCQWVPLKPINFCKWGIYCSCCVCHDEVCKICGNHIRNVTFCKLTEYEEKVTKNQVKIHKCRFCHKEYTWDALSIHERIWVASEGYKNRKNEIKSEDYKKNDIKKEKYLDMMSEILDSTKEKYDEREDIFIEEIKEKRKDLSAEKFKDLEDVLKNDAKKNKMRFENHIESMNDFFKNMHNSTEDVSQDENNFVYFFKNDVNFVHFKFDIEEGIKAK